MARLPVAAIAARSLIEAPFVVLAVLLPFAAAGPRVEWLGMSLSTDGLLAGWNILVKGTLGVLISVTLAMTTPVRDLLSGLARLRVPAMVTTIATLMVRYLEVIAAEARRMRLARVARGHDPRFLWQIGADRARRRHAVPALLRTGRARPPRDARPGLHRGDAACSGTPRRPAGPGSARSSRPPSRYSARRPGTR